MQGFSSECANISIAADLCIVLHISLSTSAGPLAISDSFYIVVHVNLIINTKSSFAISIHVNSYETDLFILSK